MADSVAVSAILRRLLFTTFLLFVLTLPMLASAQVTDVNWNGSSDSDWLNTSNWSPNFVPNNTATQFFNVTIDDSSATNLTVDLGFASVVLDSMIVGTGHTINLDRFDDSNVGRITMVVDATRAASGMFENHGMMNFATSTRLSLNGASFVNSGQMSFDVNSRLVAASTFQNTGILDFVSRAQLSQSAINNSGTIFLRDNSFATGQVELTGGGNVILEGGLINQVVNVNQKISGHGNIGEGPVEVVQNLADGIIDADANGNSLIIQVRRDMINEGTLSATNGGQLSIGMSQGTALLNTNGTIVARAQSTVDANADIEGGVITTEGNGLIFARSIRDLTNRGQVEVRDNVFGSIVNEGQILVNDSIPMIATLEGGGDVVLGDGTISLSTGQDFINVNNTIRGRGRITRGDITNRSAGFIIANSSGGTITIALANMVNQGRIQAVAGGRVLLDSGMIDNDGGVIESRNGSVLEIDQTSITGGFVRSLGTGRVVIQAGTFQDVNLRGNVEINRDSGGGSISLSGDIQTDANTTIDIVDSAFTFEKSIGIDTQVNLSGGGTINMGDDRSLILDSGGRFGAGGAVLNNIDNTIQGRGELGVGVTQILNGGLINANINGSELIVDANDEVAGVSTFASSGTIQAEQGGILTLTGSGGGEFSIDGTVHVKDRSRISFDATAVLQGLNAQGLLMEGTWISEDQGNGSTIEILNSATGVTGIGTNAHIILSGDSSAFSAGGLSLDDSLTSNDGTLDVLNGRVVNGMQQITNTGQINIAGVASSLMSQNDFVQTDGRLELIDQGTLEASRIQLTGGVVSGNGRLVGDVVLGSSAELSPGASPGILNIEGSADLAGILRMEISGLNLDGASLDDSIVNVGSDPLLADFDQINVFGDVVLDFAVFDLSQIDGFLATEGDFFDLLTADSISGTFRIQSNAEVPIQAVVLTLSDPGAGQDRDVLRFVAVPEPSSAVVLSFVCLAIVYPRRKKR